MFRIKKYKRYWALVALLCVALVTQAQPKPIELKASLKPDSILIGDHVLFTITASYNKDKQSVIFPDIKGKTGQGFDFVEQKPLDTVAGSTADKFTIAQRYVITSFDSGQHVLPSVPVIVQTDAHVDTLYTDSLRLKVSTIAIDTATYKMFDIKSPLSYPFSLWAWLKDYWWIWASVLFLILVAIGIWLYLRWKKNKSFFTLKPKEPPYVIALTELEKLKNEKLWEQDKTKQYYTRLTDIVRQYLEDTYGVQAMEQTSEEILQSLKAKGFDNNDLYECLKDMFYNSDLAKFAKYKPTAAENERSYQDAHTFVEGTIPQEKADTNDINTQRNDTNA